MLEKLDLIQIRQIVEEGLRPLKSTLRNLEADSRKMRKDINSITAFFDSEYLDLRKRVESLEEKVGIVN